MNEIKFKEFTIKELVDLYTTSNKIISDITLQREIVYKPDKQEKVIDTIYNDYVLPTLIFWETDDGVYEVIDGKQRLHSITRYVQGNLTYDGKTIKELSLFNSDKVEMFLNKKIYAQIHSGSEIAKRESFYRINTSGVPLSNYEVINGLINGIFITELNGFAKNSGDLKTIFKEDNYRGKYQYKM